MSDSGIFKAAARLSPDERREYLDEACGADNGLRQEVESLLRAHDESNGFLERPAVAPDSEGRATAIYPRIAEGPGTIIAPYKLMEQIGEGAFGLVFVAEQQQPVRRKVALKIIKPGMDTKEVIARFEAERQALALMDHPNISQVFDAGTTDFGRPYFVMELVKGIPIIEYCDSQLLTTRERLGLFVSVCQAVQHAHTKGVIHRDLKPSNILIAPHDGIPVVKVIDFGVAKAIGQQLTEKTVYTSFAQMIGTPLYMSPEQAEINALDVDTRSDIYSLGVLLYELLTGTTPFDRQRLATAAIDEIRRIIREEEPLKPSTKLSTLGETFPNVSSRRKTDPAKLSALIQGDLDCIVMKALEKDRSRRYETANSLALDIQRHLSNEPILARSPSAAYKLQKAWRKHRLAFVGVGAVAGALVAGLVLGIWIQSQRANKAEAWLALYEAARLIENSDFKSATEEMEKLPSDLVRLDGMQAWVHRVLGEYAASESRWDDAGKHFRMMMRANGNDPEKTIALDYLRYAPVLIHLNDGSAIESLRSEALAEYSATDNPVVAEEITRACLLAPTDDRSQHGWDKFYEVLLKGQQDPEVDERYQFKAWGCVALALLDYRRGQWDESIQWCQTYGSFPPQPSRDAMVHALFALNYIQLEQHESAQSELQRARAVIDDACLRGVTNGRVAGVDECPVDIWFDWEFASILSAEAAHLIEGASPI